MPTVAQRIVEELQQQRELLLSFRTGPGNYDITGLFNELTRRNGRPLDATALQYWGQQIVAVLREVEDAAGLAKNQAAFKKLYAAVKAAQR